VERHQYFCNALVDRIVPGSPPDEHQAQQKIGFADEHMVAAEPFHMWVIEAPKEAQRIFPADKAGLSVKFVEDLTLYRQQKVGILNGAHTTLVPVAYLRGLRTVKEAVDDQYVGKFIREAIAEEIIPTLDLPREDLEKYALDTLDRFQNPFIRHELKSIALNSIAKFKVRVLPTILEYQCRKGKLPRRLIQSFAALIRYYKGTWKGEALPVNDAPEVMQFFKTAWASEESEEVVKSILSNDALWGSNLSHVDGLGDAVVQELSEYSD
jgi:tagaturonate reductase